MNKISSLSSLFSKKMFSPYLRSLIAFYEFLKQRSLFGINLGLLLLICLFLPPANRFWSAKIEPQEPVLQTADISAPPIESAITSRHMEAPLLSANGIYVYELNTRSMLYQKNPDHRFYPASTTKIVSAMVAIEHYQDKEVITIPSISSVGQVLGIRIGEQYYFKDLLYGLLVQSGNDVADSLAKNYPGGYTAFINRMNDLTASLNLTDTHFSNPTGIDEYGHYISPHDLAVITTHALQNTEFASAVATREFAISDLTGNHHIQMENINQLLGAMDGIAGVKTGWTELAGECLVSLVEKDNLRVLTVLLNSQNRFGETEKINDWVYNNFAVSQPG